MSPLPSTSAAHGHRARYALPDGLFNGSGVAMMSYLGYQTARKIAGGSNAPANAPSTSATFRPCRSIRAIPWFLPLVGAWYRTRDWWIAPRRLTGSCSSVRRRDATPPGGGAPTAGLR